MMKRLAIVTGASRGIGRAIAERLAGDGYTVVGTSTSDRGAEELTKAMAAQGLDVIGKTLDVSSRESIEKFFCNLSDGLGHPEVLVNNAGMTKDSLFLRMKDDDWETIISTNLSSVFYMCKEVVRGMTKRRYGRIVNITSIVGATGNVGQANYAASKAGIIGLTKTLAKEVASRGITVNAVAPGFIDTDMTRDLPGEIREKLLAGIPLGKLGDVNDIAATVSFLCSKDASYITGETVHVNGGMYMA